jgi:radical SAM superfamily enzyme YgiQ (UPF0313 family)
MRVALVRPNHHSHLIQPPLALGYLASYLQSQGHQTRTVDGVNLDLTNEALAERCADADLVGVSVLSDYYPQTVELAKLLKGRGLKVVMGGPHVAVIPKQVLEETGADFAVMGEGEAAMGELAASLQEGGDGEGLAGVLTRRTPEAPVRQQIKDLDSLPFPDWDQMAPSTYPMAPHGGVAKNYPIAPMTSSRGCPYACSFCSSPSLWQRRIRFRSPDNVVQEVEWMVRRYGVKEIHFEDDNLTMRREHAWGIAEGMLRKGLRVSWATPNGIRADKVDRELMTLMRDSGLYSVAFGIESADPEVLRRCGKKATVDHMEKAINIASDLGIITQGFFIFGLPGETPQSIERTINFAVSSRLDKAQFLLLDVMPGTRIWDEMEHKPDLSSYQSYHDITWCPDGLDPDVLKKTPGRAFRKFFLSRPRRVLKMLSMIRPAQLRFVLRRMSDFRILPVRD